MKKVKENKEKKIITPWQEVIPHWKEWKRSIDEVKQVILAKYGEQTPILLAKDSEPMYKLIDEVCDLGYDFVIKEIGLHPESEYFEDFLFTWMHVVLDEISYQYDRDFSLKGKLPRKGKIWVDSRPDTIKGKVVIVSSINWITGKVRRSELTKKMQDKDWPPQGLFKEKKKAGRPSQKDLTNMQAIVCVLLKDRENLTYEYIGDLFGWESTPDDYEKHKICHTARDRADIGRKLLKY